MKSLRWVVLVGVTVGIVATAIALWARLNTGEALHVKKVLIDVDPAALAASVDREQVRRVVTETLASTRGVVIDEEGGDLVLRVLVESYTTNAAAPVPEGHPAMATSASLSLQVEVLDNGRTAGRGHSVATAQGVMGADALVGQALRDAVRQIQQARTADDLDSDTLLTWLTDPSTGEGQRRRAMQALASRRERRATPALVALLQTQTDSPAALQALTVLGDPDAVDAIIDYSARQPALVRNLCIDAVRAAGSARAVPWLFTLSSGHPDADVQAHARAALAQLAPELTTAATPHPQAGAVGG